MGEKVIISIGHIEVSGYRLSIDLICLFGKRLCQHVHMGRERKSSSFFCYRSLSIPS